MRAMRIFKSFKFYHIPLSLIALYPIYIDIKDIKDKMYLETIFWKEGYDFGMRDMRERGI